MEKILIKRRVSKDSGYILVGKEEDTGGVGSNKS